jgi:hypothetical protein
MDAERVVKWFNLFAQQAFDARWKTADRGPDVSGLHNLAGSRVRDVVGQE